MSAASREQPQHFSVEAEQQLIGRVLTDESALSEALAHCAPEDFAWGPHARIVETAKALRDDGMIASALTVKARLGECSELDANGGLEYLKNVCRLASFAQAPADLARIIADLAMRRRLDAELEAGRERLTAHDRPITECIAGVIDASGHAIDRQLRSRGYLPFPDAVDDVLRVAEAAFNGLRPPAIHIGLTRLDGLVGGFHAGDFIVVAGRPGMGKSVLLNHVCKAAAMDGAPAIQFSLEMPRAQNLQRLIADIDYDEYPADPLHYTWFRKGALRAEQLDRAARAGMRLRQLPIEIHDNSGVTVHEIAAVAERFAAKQKRMGIVAVDYLQIVQPTDRYAGSKVQEVTEISNGLKTLAKRIGWPVVAGCQLHRGVEGREQKRPRLADLRESGAIEQDADVVLGLFRRGYYVEDKRPEYGSSDPAWATWKAEYDAVKNDLDIGILKNRNGPTGTVSLHVEIAASAIRNRAGDDSNVVEYPEGYAR